MAVIQMQAIWLRQNDGTVADKPSNVPTILGVVGTMMGLSTVCTLLRIYVRCFMIKHFGMDDVIMVFAWLAAVGSMVCLVGETHYGAGSHFKDIDIMNDFPKLLYWQYIHGPLLVTGISLVKVSLGFFLLRFVQGKWYKRFIIFMIVFILLFTLTCDLTLALQCIPPYLTYTLPRPPDANCFSTETFLRLSTFNGVMNILTDAVFVLLPVPVIIGLQVNKRVKITLLFILSLGLFACIASIVRVYMGSILFENPDYTWAYAFFIWNLTIVLTVTFSSAELHTGIIAACLPALRPLFSSILENTSRRLRATGYLYGSRYGNNKYGSKSNNRSGYQRQDDDGVGLESLQRNNRLEEGMYNARVTSTKGTNVSRGDDDSSEDGILPPQGAVIKTTEIVVTQGKSRS